MKSKLKIIIPSIIAIIAVIIAVICIKFTPNETVDFDSLISTAQKYLIEQNYEQAIAEFEKIIELDPMSADAYIGIAEAYEGIGDTDKAVEWLEKGYEVTGDERILKKLEMLRQPEETEAVTESTTVTTPEAATTTVKLLTVPDLSGMSEEEAIAACEAAGITYEIITEDSEDIEEGYVVSQRIPANAEIEEKIKFVFVVSEGKKEVTTVESTVTTAVPTTLTTTVPTTVVTNAPAEEFITIKDEQYSTSLTHLYLVGKSLTDEDIKPLSKMTNLTALWLDSNNISNISALSGLTNLTYLYLDRNDISDISALSGLTNLTYLNLEENNISDISALSGLTNLTYLRLCYNNINYISALSGLTNLTYLNLSGNNVSESDIEALEKALPDCDIWD